jgi:psp operon transcriptional activator
MTMANKTTSQSEALGESEAFLDFQSRLAQVAPVERPVLLIGERGTGKELAASRLHYLSRRWDGPFVTLNCATLSASLIEAELFGHEKGAFTGAEMQRAGRFETADGGTLFLDEIGTIPIPVQEKILRVVEYGSFERVGGSTPIEDAVRIVGATNENLVAMADRHDFKRDLLDRLSFEVLFLPPLRVREEVILLLDEHFAARMAFELGYKDVPGFSSKAVGLLKRYPWKGNVRELKNVVERAVYQAEGKTIDHIVFDPFVSPYPFEPLTPDASPPCAEASSGPDAELIDLDQPFKELIRQHEIRLLRSALERSRFNQRNAANLLQLTYDQFRGLLRKHQEVI